MINIVSLDLVNCYFLYHFCPLSVIILLPFIFPQFFFTNNIQLFDSDMKNPLIVGIIFTILITTQQLNLYYAIAEGQSGNSLIGSVEGGTKLIIRGTGFISDFTQIQVMVGPYPCLLEDGVPPTSTSISCFTSNSGTDSDKNNLSIQVIQEGEPYTLQAYTFSYKFSNSPYIYNVNPSTSMPSDYLYYHGIHRVDHSSESQRDTQDILGLHVDSELCNIIGISQAFSSKQWVAVKCTSSSNQEGGNYNISEQTVPGYAVKSDYMIKSSFSTDHKYEHTVLPTIQSVTPNTGLPDGQQIVIDGSGFSNDKSKIQVSVDDVGCEVTAATTNRISCTLGKKTTLLQKLPTDATSQIDGFIGGSGFKYEKYNIGDLSVKNYQNLKDAIDTSSGIIFKMSEGIIGELESDQSGLYGKVFKGYFYAHISGNYIFRGAGDDNFGLYISDNYGTATVNPSPYIYQNSHTDQRDNYYIWNIPSALGAERYFEGGKYYYMELYLVNTGGVGFVKVSVETPNTDINLLWQRHQVNELEISYTNDPEVRQFVLQGEDIVDGSFKLSMTEKQSEFDLISTTYSIDIPYDATADDFKKKLEEIPAYQGGYGLTVELQILDQNGTETTPDSAEIFKWTVSIEKLRPQDKTQKYFDFDLSGITATTVSFTETELNPHGPLITGTFTMQIGNEQVQVYDQGSQAFTPNIPFDVDHSTLQGGIRRISGLEHIELYQFQQGCSYGCRFLISYMRYNNDVPDLTLSSAMLSGGQQGTSPLVSFFETRKYSSNLLFNPVDERFLFTNADMPHVHVKVNDVLDACLSDCEYDFQIIIPQVTSQSITNTNQVTVTVSDPNSSNYDLSTLNVKVAGQQCSNIVGTFTSFTCDLPTNTDGTPTIEAGSHDVQIWIAEQGLVQIEDTTPPLDFPLTIDTITPTSGGSNGGYQIDLSGKGFPLNVQDAKIQLCGVTIIPETIDNILTTFTAPECSQGTQQLTYTYNGQTATINFDFVAAVQTATITSINPVSASPVLKDVMEIHGSNFPLDSTTFKIHLANGSGNVYQMRVLQNDANYIKCGIPGGLPGQFKVLVDIDGNQGNAVASPQTANDFVYELVITNISPNQGQYNGGTLITITGRNFSPDIRENMVTVGHQLNWLCQIESVTETQILCRTPPYHPDWSSSTQQVILTNRLIIDNTCQGTCEFTYLDEPNSLQLSSLSSTTMMSGSGTLTLNGVNFDKTNLNDLRVIFTNDLTGQTIEVIPSTTSSQSITCDIPSVEAGSYKVKVRLDPIGETNHISVKINGQISQNFTNGSINGGSVKLVGNGLPKNWPSKLWSLKIMSNGKSRDINVISTDPTQMEIKIEAGTDNQVYSIVLLNPNQQELTCNHTQLQGETPELTLQVSSPISAGTNSISLSIDKLTSQDPTKLYSFNVLNPASASQEAFTRNANEITSTVDLTSGQYRFKVWYQGKGWATVNGFLNVQITGSYSVSSVDTSFAGGQFAVTGTDISPEAIIKIGGFVGKRLREESGSTIFEVPPLTTPQSIVWYPTLKKIQKIEPSGVISDGGSEPEDIIDSRHHTQYSSTNNDCYIGIDIGENKVVNPTRIRYFPYSQWAVVASYLKGAIIQASMDQNANYVQLHKVGPQVHSGWNSFLIESTSNYRFFRIRHNSQSECKIGQIQVIGTLFNGITATPSTSVDVIFDDGANQQTWNNMVVYKQTQTPVIEQLSETTGSIYGGQQIIITGQNLGNLQILIDQIPCAVQTHTATSVVCLTGQRLNLPAQNTFKVSLNGNKAVIEQQFLYVMRWSDIRTWGTDLLPVEGDLVYVPKGMTLYVDQSTPLLEGIIVEEGKIVFADEGPMEIHTNFITLVKGQFKAGTKNKPYQNDLTFIMYGNYHGKQQPMFGNKGIGCKQCKFSMYGKIRPVTWTMLSDTVNPGDTTLNVIDSNIDWQPGQKIVIASTDFDHNEAQQKTIASVSGTTITVEEPFKYKHFSGLQTYGSDQLQMRAQVGLLSRNIKMMGDQTSQPGQYGSHLMMAGSAQDGMISHIGYTQFTHCGQPRIVGRYCIHFHMNGDVVDSQVTGNSVHHSFARVLTLHAIQYLRVKDNVGYLVKGHNFFIEDGIETHNILDHNLAISSLQTFNMMQTDTSVASFWVTNPLNDLINNHAAGGDFYGFWYEIKQHPDGPSSRSDVCPIGNRLGSSRDNVAHSYLRFGLRIFKLYSRQTPCAPIRDDSNTDDPWASNPSIQSIFSNYVTYKIGQAGLLAEEVGNIVFDNFIIAECKHAGMQFYKTNFTKQSVIAKNSVIIGVTQGNAPTNLDVLSGSRGVIGPRTSGWEMQNIRFYDFLSTQTVFETCSKCDSILIYTNRAIEYFIQQISCTNISGKYLFQNGLKRTIIYDTDASLSAQFDSTSRSSATFVHNFPHLSQQTACLQATNPDSWDQSLVCDQSVLIRGVTVTNVLPHFSFRSVPMKIQKIMSTDEIVDESTTDYTEFYSLFGGMEPKDKKFSWSMPYVAGNIYNIWWLTGIDFTHIAIELSPLYQDSEPAIIFRFNYTENRELFQIGDLVKKTIVGEYRNVSEDELDISTCNLGDYTHNNDVYQCDLNVTDPADCNQTLQRNLTLCLSSRGKNTTYQYLDVNGIKCRYHCPSPSDQFEKQDKERYWSNPNDWPSGQIPQAGENVTIQGAWVMILDMQPAQIEFLHIDGDLIIQQSLLEVRIVAYSIWIRAGSLVAGSQQFPYEGSLTFEIKGEKNDAGYVLTPEIAGNKLFVVHGKLHLYGVVPETTWTKMSSFALKGSSEITVESASGWSIGDFITIAPSFTDPAQHQKVQITQIVGNVLKFTPSLQFNHYGSQNITIEKEGFGSLDTRTAVGLMSRNIKIVSGEDSGWGYRLIVNSFLDDNITRKGHIILKGVELKEGGQYDTEYSALEILTLLNPETSKISKSVFHNCKSYCLDLNAIMNLDVVDNVFYLGRIHHVRAISLNNYNFKNNLMVAAIKRPTFSGEDLIACYASWEEVDQTVSVTDNVCQGSDLHGFALGFTACENQVAPYQNNVASSAPACFIFNKISSSSCMKASGVKAFGCGIGQISSPPGTESIVFENFIIADSGRAVTLRFGKEGDDRSAFFKNSYITAISRPQCSQCYGQNTNDCSNNHALRMLAVTVNGESMPAKFGTGFDVICKQQTYDAKAFLDNVIFDNYRISYDQLPQCSNNVVFKAHKGASDMTGSHNLRNTKCQNCQLQALAHFDPPNPNHLTWFGGCGDILCTGKNNYLIHDYSGGFLPTPGILIANNSEIGDNTDGCTFIEPMNGHHCTRQDFSVLQYESIAPDFNTRIMWPVYLKYDGGQWNSTTNGWRQWEWQGNQPLNKRLGRFVSIVQLQKTYNMTFESEPPIDMRLQFQRRSVQGDNNQYIIIKLKYPRPNSIRVQNRGTTIKPITLHPNQQQKLDPTVCGSNKFFYQNNTVHFVITGDKNCQVRVSLTNSIQLTARFNMDIDNFFDIDGPTKFIDRMCALLEVKDTSRLKIVGIYEGSTVLQAFLEEPAPSVEQSKQHDNVEGSDSMQALRKTLMQKYENGEVDALFPSEEGFGEVIQFNSAKYDHLDTIDIQEDPTPDSNQEQEKVVELNQNDLGLIIGLSLGGLSILVAVIVTIVYVIKKKKKTNKVDNIQHTQQKMQTNQAGQQNLSVMDFTIKK